MVLMLIPISGARAALHQSRLSFVT